MMNPAAGDLFAGSLFWSAVGALWAWALAVLLGAALLPRRWDAEIPAGLRLLSWAVLGMVVQTQLWFLLSLAGRLQPGWVLGAAGAMTLVGLIGATRVFEAIREARPTAGSDLPALTWTARVVMLLFALVVVRLAVWPTVFYDDLVYHVGAPRQALLTGVWPAMPGMHYSYMPAGWDAAYLIPLALGGGCGPQLMNAMAMVLLAWAVARLARRGGGPAAASASTALFLVCPMMGSLGGFAGNDLYVGLALAVAVERLLVQQGQRPAAVGLLTGAAWGAKLTALPGAAGVALAAMLYRGSWLERCGRSAIIGVVTLAVAATWTVRSWMLTGNPLYPAFYGLFGGRHWNEQSARVVAETVAHGGLEERGLLAFVLGAWDMVTRSGELGFPSGINPLFVLLGLGGLLVLPVMRRVSGGPVLAVVGAVSYVGWCATSLNLRYGLILLAVLAPFAAALIQLGLELIDRADLQRLLRPLTPLLLILALTGPGIQGVKRHVSYYGPETSLFETTERGDMQVTRLHLAAAGRWMADHLPDDARILLIAEGRVGLLPRPALASSAYDHPDIARFAAGANSPDQLNQRLTDFTHVVVNERELVRFEEKFGFVERFGPGEWELFRRWLAAGLEPLVRLGNVVVYRIPRSA